MARIRSIKPEFWSSEQIVECSPIARLLFVGMWTFADDRGVIPRRPRTIKMQVFPGDDITIDQIESLIRELETKRLVGRFEHDGETYLAVTGWRHQKIERPTYKYPAPPESLQFGDVSSSNRRRLGDYSPPEGIGEDRSGEEGIGEELNTGIDDTSASTRRFVKPSFLDVSSYCLERKNAVDPQAFLDHYESNGWKIGKASMKDWRAAVRTWERNGRSKKAEPVSRVATQEDAREWTP